MPNGFCDEWVVRVQKNEYKKDLGSLHVAFENLSEENKRCMELMLFDGINNTFFRYVPAKTLIATLHSWLDCSMDNIEKYCSKTNYTAPYINPKTQIEKWAEILKPLRNKADIYIVNHRANSERSLSALLSDLFLNPKSGISSKSKKAGNLVRLLIFITIRHYFMLSEEQKKDFGSIERRIESIRTLIEETENNPIQADNLLNAANIDEVVTYILSILNKPIDSLFFEKSLRIVFDDGFKEVGQLNDSISSLRNDGEVVTSQTHNFSSEPTTKTLNSKSFSSEPLSTHKNKLPKSYLALKALCHPDSLTSMRKLQRQFLDYQRRPEYALNLKTLNYSLRLEEKQHIVSNLLRDLADENVSRFALTICLEILTSSTLERLTSFTVLTKDNPEFVNMICLQTGMWKRRSVEFERSFSPNADQTNWLYCHDEYLWLPLPDMVISRLQKLIKHLNISDEEVSSGIPLYRLIGLHEDDFIPKLNSYLNNLKRSLNYGFKDLTQKSMRYALFAQVAHDVDASFAAMLFANIEFSNPTTLFYLSASEGSLQRHYNNALETVGFNVGKGLNPRDTYVGSRMCVNIGKISARIEENSQQINSLIQAPFKSPEQVIHCHNEFACLVALGFAFCGAVREQSTYFFDDAVIDERQGFFFVCDKYHQGENPTRLIPLPERLVSLLTQYRLQLRQTSYELKEVFPNLARLLYSLYQPTRQPSDANIHYQTGQPLLGLIVEGKWQAVSSDMIVKFLGNDFTLPVNFTRHLTCSNLPPSLTRYRQHLLGHNSVGHHVLDDMALNVNWLNSPDIKHQLNVMLDGLGIQEVHAQSLRGAYALARLPPQALYYPDGYTQRETRQREVFTFAKKHFLALLDRCESAEELELQLPQLPTNHKDADTKISAIDVKSFYVQWHRAFNRTQSKISVKRLLNRRRDGASSSLRFVEYGNRIEHLQRHFLGYISIGEARFSSATFLISLSLYQPRVAAQLLTQGKKVTFSVKKHQSTLLIFVTDKGLHQVSAPINWLSSSLLVAVKKNSRFTINLNEANVQLRAWLKVASVDIGNVTPKLSSFKQLCSFVSEYGLSTQSRLSVSASKDSLLPGDYPVQDIARLLEHGSDHHYEYDLSSLPKTFKSVGNRKLLRSSYNPDSESHYRNESLFIEELLAALKDMNNVADEISVERKILTYWANFIGTQKKDLEHLRAASKVCSEFLALWLFYGVIVSRRLSSKNKNNKVKAQTVRAYLKVITEHLRQNILAEPWLVLDDLSFEIIYSQALKRSSNQDKHQVFERFKDFHTVINKFFSIDQPEWTNIENIIRPKQAGRVGIARLLPIAAYQRAQEFFRNESFKPGSQNEVERLESDMHIVVLALGYRGGIREQEIRNLLVKQINTELRILTVTVSRYYGTKSINSPRRIDVTLMLDDIEWESLLRVIAHAKIIGGELRSPAIFGAGSLESRLMRIDALTSNVIDVCRILTGNPQLRFYDLRHSCINYSIMILASVYEDKRYQTSLARWARIKPTELSSFREKMVKRLIGQQAEVGGILIYALADSLGHSHITERQYYIHTLNIIDEVMTNRLISEQIGNSPFFARLKQDFGEENAGFRPELAVRRAIKSLTMLDMSKTHPVLPSAVPSGFHVLGAQFIFESYFMDLYYCLAESWAARDNTKIQDDIASRSSLTFTGLRTLHAHIENCGYRGIYLPPLVDKSPLEVVEEQVEVSLRFISVPHFKSLVTTVASLYETNPDALKSLLNFYAACQRDDQIIVTQNEVAILEAHLSVFEDLQLEFLPISSPDKIRGRNKQYFKLNVRAKKTTRKTSNHKLSFLVALSLATIKGLEETESSASVTG